MKIIKFSKLKKDNDGQYTFSYFIGKGPSSRKIQLSLGIENTEKIEVGLVNPINASSLFKTGSWIFKNYLLETEGVGETLEDEEIIFIKHFVLKKEKELEKISKEVEAFENFDKTQESKRERIPNNVRLFVWQRDEGKCVLCGNKEKLEFDHIIPVIEGGANTERNIQILCENCNRSKGRKI